MTRKILVTSALPYANGHIHLGHLVEYIQTDIWARFQRLVGNRCVYICADDTHGTAIMMRARQEGRTEEALIADMSAAHQRDFAGFRVEFDHYGSTNSPSNRQVCVEIWNSLTAAGLVSEREVTQLYDIEAGTFLADRFVKGICPNCQALDQYGDNCDSCGATYSPAELVDPVSTLSGTTPEIRSAKHLFVNVEGLHSFLDEWTSRPGVLQPEMANYLNGHFLGEPLRDWDISRPAPYFGFEIPDSPGNFWYVWFDAPIGYIGATKEWCDTHGEDFDAWWRSEQTEIHHFIGKDITYFHTLFWPAMLKTAGFNLPRRVQIHGFLTVNGEKLSKRKGTVFQASTYLKHLDPAFLRYYYASKLSSRIDDLDLNLGEFVARVNSDLVGKVVNIASRSARFVKDSGLSPEYPGDDGLFAQASAQADDIASAYDSCDYAKAMRLIMALADRANEFVDRKEPWKLKKDPEQARAMQDVCTIALNLFRQIAIFLAPVLPGLREQTESLFGMPIHRWDDAKSPIVGRMLAPFEHMMQRVTQQQVDALVADSVEAPAAGASEAAPVAGPTESQGEAFASKPLEAECSIDEFTRVDLRVAQVLAAESVPEARKLLKLTLGLGGSEKRTVFAGIKSAYEPEMLVGRLVVMVANLKPRKMKFGISEGMVLAAGEGGADLFVLSPDSGAKPGQRVS